MNNYSKQNNQQEFSMNQKQGADKINATIEELDDTQLESVCGGILRWCPQRKRWVDVRDYSMMPVRDSNGMRP